MEAMALDDEMDQDYRQKSGQEEHDDAVQDQIRAKEKEIKELREEIRELRAKIRELRAEIRVKEEEKRRMEEIAIASEAEVRKVVETEMQFLWQHMINHDQQIISRDQQIISLRQELSCLRSMQEARASAGPSLGLLEKFLQNLTEIMAQMKAEQKLKKSVQLSSVSQSIWDTLQHQAGLKMMFHDVELEPKRLSDLAAFSWDDKQEMSQADRYIPHISKIARGQKCTLIDAANDHPTLLSGFFGGWNFKGTIDVAFVHRRILKFEPRRGLKAIFKLKKDFRGGHENAMIQTLICLVMANVFAQQFKPFAVLTDLDDYWSLYWMDGSTIHWCTFESRARAVGCIEEFLQDFDDNEMGT